MKTIEAYQGETVAAAMLAAGIHTFYKSRNYSNRAVCIAAWASVMNAWSPSTAVHAQRACITPVAEGMQIETCKELEL